MKREGLFDFATRLEMAGYKTHIIYGLKKEKPILMIRRSEVTVKTVGVGWFPQRACVGRTGRFRK